MANTKAKILDTSLRLFNENGLQNTPALTIAKDMGMSVGNLAYHYKNIDEIIAAHAAELEEQLLSALAHFRNYPNFLDFHIQLEQIFNVLNTYRFLFRNLGEIKANYPIIFEVIRVFDEKLHVQIESRVLYHIDRGTLLSNTPASEIADIISDLIISSQIRVLFQENPSTFHQYQRIWQQVFPYLTEKGKQEWAMLIHPTLSD